MIEKIRIHVEELFKEAPKTKRAYDLKEELISNLEEKFNDLVSKDTSEEQAFESVILGIGDISELILELNKENASNMIYSPEMRKKTAIVVSVSVGLYFLSLVSAILFSELSNSDFMQNVLTPVSLFFFAGLATCILIYHFLSRPKYVKIDDTLVEEFKEWKSNKNKNKEIRKAVSSILWPLIVVIYLAVSFGFGIWSYSWILFIIGAVIENIINLIFKLKE